MSALHSNRTALTRQDSNCSFQLGCTCLSSLQPQLLPPSLPPPRPDAGYHLHYAPFPYGRVVVNDIQNIPFIPIIIQSRETKMLF